MNVALILILFEIMDSIHFGGPVYKQLFYALLKRHRLDVGSLVRLFSQQVDINRIERQLSLGIHLLWKMCPVPNLK